LSDLNSLEVYIKAIDSSTWTNVTSIWVIVDYTEGAGGAAGNMLLMFA
jgi:hypothetical protein